MKKIFSHQFILLLFASLLFTTNCKKDNPQHIKEEEEEEEEEVIKFDNPYLNTALKYGSLVDIDSNLYPTIEIGTQVWMAENLKTSKLNDGTPISNITKNSDWEKSTTGAWSYYNNNATLGKTYGKLYNWHAVNTGKICPTGWHIPSEAEWKVLAEYLGGSGRGGVKMKTPGNKEDSTGLWTSPNAGATNESGFTGLPGGFRHVQGEFVTMGDYSYWWSTTESYLVRDAISFQLAFDRSGINGGGTYKATGFYCRCIKD